MAVRGVLAQADVRDEHELRLLGAERPQCLLDDPVLDPRARALVVLLLGDSEEEHGLDPERDELAGLRDERPRPSSATCPAARRSRRSSARRRAAGRSRRARAASLARASGARRCAAAGATAWRERRSSTNRVRQPGREKSSCWNNTSSGRQPRDHEPGQQAVGERQPHEPRRLAQRAPSQGSRSNSAAVKKRTP